MVDDLEGLAAVCRDRGLWLHVDGAYGGAGLLAPSVRDRFRGIEHADSLIVDPHKWLFAPYDSPRSCRDPRDRAVGAPTGRLLPGRAQRELRVEPERLRPSPLPTPAGLPLWFSLATYGTDAYRDAVERVLSVTREAAEEIGRRPELELVLEPELSVVLFRRLGWGPDDYEAWWRRALERQVGFVQPTTWEGEKVAGCASSTPAPPSSTSGRSSTWPRERGAGGPARPVRHARLDGVADDARRARRPLRDRRGRPPARLRGHPEGAQHRLRQRRGRPAAILDAAGIPADPELVRELDAARVKAFAENGVHLWDDSIPTLRELRARGFRTAVVSNAPFHAPIVDELGLADEADAVLLSFEVGVAKPDAEDLPGGARRAGRATRGIRLRRRPRACDGAEALGIRSILILRDDAEPVEGTSAAGDRGDPRSPVAARPRLTGSAALPGTGRELGDLLLDLLEPRHALGRRGVGREQVGQAHRRLAARNGFTMNRCASAGSRWPAPGPCWRQHRACAMRSPGRRGRARGSRPTRRPGTRASGSRPSG